MKLDKVELRDKNVVVRYYACNFNVVCDGSSLWSNTCGRTVHVYAITVVEYEDGRMVNVKHDSDWTVYSDRGFANGISQMLGYKVTFTEQGMQQDGYASLESA